MSDAAPKKVAFVGGKSDAWFKFASTAAKSDGFQLDRQTFDSVVCCREPDGNLLVIIDWKVAGLPDSQAERMVRECANRKVMVAILEDDPVRERVKKIALAAGACFVFPRIFDRKQILVSLSQAFLNGRLKCEKEDRRK